MFADKSKDELEREFYIRSAAGKSAYAALISNTSVVITPAAGKKVIVYWVYAITDPDSTLSPLITISLGARALYAGYAISHAEVFEGAVGETVTVTLSEAAPVAVTIHYREL